MRERKLLTVSTAHLGLNWEEYGDQLNKNLCQHDKMRCVRMSSPDAQMAAYLHQTRDPALGYTT
jgi:hypothetical protein